MRRKKDQTVDQIMSNLDEAEIAKFEALAARWWDLDGDFKPLHQMNPLRAEYIDQNSPVQGLNYLDVGCGGGILTESMATKEAIATGIDMGEAPLSVARLHALETGVDINYVQITAEDLAGRTPEAYEVVSCMEMLEHVPDPASTVQACADLAKPGATLYFSTINRSPKAFAFAIVGAEYILNVLPRGTHEYKKFIRPSELARAIRQAGLILEDSKGVLYNPFSGKFRLSDSDLDVNYMMRARKPDAAE